MKFHIQIPHEKIFDPYFFMSKLCPFLELCPFENKFENLVCKISQKVLELESSYLVYWLMLKSSPGKLLRTFSQISTKLLLF